MKKKFPLAERDQIRSMKLENKRNRDKLRMLSSRNKKKTYYGQHKAVFTRPNLKTKKKSDEKKFKKRMTMFQLKRKKSLSEMKKELDTQQGLTFQPKINEVSKKLVGHIRPFYER
jgi:hypothetical protein